MTRRVDAVEASDLGWPPGFWPDHPVIDGTRYTRSTVTWDADGDIRSVTYRGAQGALTIVVYND